MGFIVSGNPVSLLSAIYEPHSYVLKPLPNKGSCFHSSLKAWNRSATAQQNSLSLNSLFMQVLHCFIVAITRTFTFIKLTFILLVFVRANVSTFGAIPTTTYPLIFCVPFTSHHSAPPFSVGWSSRKHTSAKMFIFFVDLSLQSSDGNSVFGLSLYLQISHSFLAHIDKRIKAWRSFLSTPPTSYALLLCSFGITPFSKYLFLLVFLWM